MADTTTEIITVDGVSLKTYAKNIESIAATLYTPGKRGANASAAMRSGTVYGSNKPHDAGNMVWGMWVQGTDDDGAIPSGTARTWFYSNIDALSRLFDKPHGLLDIRHTLPDGSIRQCYAECVDAIDFSVPNNAANPLGFFKVELEIPGSFWQDVSETAGTKNTSLAYYTVMTGGTAPVEDATYIIAGPITNPKIEDEVTGAYVQYNAALTVGQTLTLNAGTYAVTGSGITPNLSNLVLSNTNGRLMRMVPNASGQYRVRLTGSGTAAGVGLTVNMRRKYLVG